MRYIVILLLFFSCLPLFLLADSSENVIVDLHSPTYEGGILSTTEGGVLKSKNIRIQAQNIKYIRKTVDGKSVEEVEASDDLMVEWKKSIFTGKKIKFDFSANKGKIYDGKTQSGSWFLGGSEILLKPNGSYKIKDPFVTTCENSEGEWQIRAKSAKVKDTDLFSANNISIRFFHFPVFWFPAFKMRLRDLSAIPTQYTVKLAGGQGPYISMRQQIYSWREWKAFLQLDYWWRHGPGGAIQTDYQSQYHPTNFRTNNFMAFDLRSTSEFRGFRYRYTGELNSKLLHEHLTLSGQYEKLSDTNVLETYFNRDYFLQTERHTHLQFRAQEKNFISTLLATPRINEFQTVNQKLPGFSFLLKPLSIPKTPFIFDATLDASNLAYVFGSAIKHIKDLYSPRVELHPNLYFPLNFSPLTITPKAGFRGIFYGKSPENHPVMQVLGDLGCAANLQLSKYFGRSFKHAVQPYGEYHYLTNPTVPYQDHYIFDINDAYTHLNQFRYGIRNEFYYKKNNEIYRPLYFDLYTYSFLNNKAIGTSTPKVYLHLSSRLDFLYSELKMAWNIQHNQLDHLNIRTDWTLSDNLAVGFLYMQRGDYDWRKANHDNYTLDVYRPEATLLNSPLSDKRDTIVTRFYWHFLNDFVLQCESRIGWARPFEPDYNEYRIHLTTYLPCSWQMKLSFIRTEQSSTRFTVAFLLGEKTPKHFQDKFVFW